MVPLDEFTGSNPNPLGSFDFCTNAGDACLAIVDTGKHTLIRKRAQWLTSDIGQLVMQYLLSVCLVYCARCSGVLWAFRICMRLSCVDTFVWSSGQLFNVVPPAAFAALNTFVGANSAAPLPNGLPSIPCPAVATNTQIINFVIAGRVYTLSPRQYINTVRYSHL